MMHLAWKENSTHLGMNPSIARTQDTIWIGDQRVVTGSISRWTYAAFTASAWSSIIFISHSVNLSSPIISRYGGRLSRGQPVGVVLLLCLHKKLPWQWSCSRRTIFDCLQDSISLLSSSFLALQRQEASSFSSVWDTLLKKWHMPIRWAIDAMS